MSDVKPLTFHDQPNSYIGRSVPRPNARRLLQGRGKFVDDISLPRMLHAAFVRSPYAHARVAGIDKSEALKQPGVFAVVTGKDLEDIIKPWVGVLTHLDGLKSAPQYALPVEKASWQGEPVAAVLADSRAEAEDGAVLVEVDWEELPAVTDAETALDPATPVIHPELGDNLAWERLVDVGDVDGALANADVVVESEFTFGRHTGVTNESRGLVADYNPAEDTLTVYHSGQAPHSMQAIFAAQLDMEEPDVRVICEDVGGAYGIKAHTYSDEMATLAMAKLFKRPVKFIADRIESFVSDLHARDHKVTARMAVNKDGKIQAIDLEDLTGVGPFSMYPRTSAIETNQVLNLTGGQYVLPNYRAKGTIVFQNKNMMSQYRAVGHPIASTIGEGLADLAAEAIGMDPAEIRRINVVPDDAYPTKTPSGLPIQDLSHQKSLDKLLEIMDYEALKAERDELRQRGVYRGIGLASFIEVTSPGPWFYGAGGARISATDGATLRLDPSGIVIVSIGVTEQGQGTESIIAQVAATAVGVAMEKVRVIHGDTGKVAAYGGGVWGSRGAAIGGEATFQAGKALKEQVLEVAAAITQVEPDQLDIVDGVVVDADGGAERITLKELASMAQFKTADLPDDLQPELVATRHFRITGMPFVLTNGAQGSYVEVDAETGFIRLLNHWCVDDCGVVLNPMLVDEQVRGGAVQGIGGVLFEHCIYSPEGQMLNANMADYLVPMAAEMPDISVSHVETPSTTSELGAKGVGEAGTGAAPAVVLNAVNDALRPLSARVTAQPITPQRVLEALGKF
jgi:carbon-monoxide dehydrogenase large subunit